MMAELKNAHIALSVSEEGLLTCLALDGRNVIARPAPLFRAVLVTGTNHEDVVFQKNQKVQVSQEAGAILVRVKELATRDGVRDIAITMKITLQNADACFTASIENRSESTVSDFYYPCIGAIDTLEGGSPDWLVPIQSGERYNNVAKLLEGMEGREFLHEITICYPGDSYPGGMSMQWTLLEDGGTCLYYASRDDLFHACTFRASGRLGGITLEKDTMSFVKPGETWACPAVIVRLYKGSWMEAAKAYAAWATKWRKPVKRADWIRKMNGYFLVINKQQYGDENWSYDTLPKLYELAQAHGCDVLGLFGWYHSGHDNQYPMLEVSPTMGGEEALKENIRKVQEAGGHVTLYYQGHLMDITNDYYKKIGCKLEGKNRWGTPYYEFYPKFDHADSLRFFSRKAFTTVCPSCPEWHDLMVERAKWIHSLGADGVLYDQIGGMTPYPCFDESHPHMQNRPSLSYTQGRLKLHGRIRAEVNTYSGFAYMSEHITDVYSQFLDCLHGLGAQPGAKVSSAKGTCNKYANSRPIGADDSSQFRPAQKEARHTMMPELFRYCFPETPVTVRNPNPYIDRRFANYAFLYGFKMEMELRYFTDKEFILNDEDPERRIWVKKVSDLRRRFSAYLLEGFFRAEEGLQNTNPNVKACVFEAEDGKRAAALWNDTDEAQQIDLTLDGMKLNAWASPDGEGEGIPESMPAESILLLYAK